jgi:hypothetical protein
MSGCKPRHLIIGAKFRNVQSFSRGVMSNCWTIGALLRHDHSADDPAGGEEDDIGLE